MDAGLAFQYDREAAILHISTRARYPEQQSDELDEGVMARLNR